MHRGIFAAAAIVAGGLFSVSPISAAGAGQADGSHTAASAEIREAREQWLAGAMQAALRFGCTPDSIQQLSSESVEDAIQYFGQTAKPGACLILAPISNDPATMRYSLATGGTVNGMEIRYLSDVAQVRIQHGAAVSSR